MDVRAAKVKDSPKATKRAESQNWTVLQSARDKGDCWSD